MKIVKKGSEEYYPLVGAYKLEGVGEETTILWEGFVPIKKVELVPTLSTFGLYMTPEREAKVKAAVEPILARGGFDGPKWRTELVHPREDGGVTIYVSPTTYFTHAALRGDRDSNGNPLPMHQYVNPITINTVLRTADGKIAIGERKMKGGASDQTGLCLMMSGFVDRSVLEDNPLFSRKPSLEKTLISESDELDFKDYNFEEEYDSNNAKVTAIVYGSNHDTTVGIVYDVPLTHKEISLPKTKEPEHQDLIWLNNNLEDIAEIIRTGGIKGKPAADHMLGVLAKYLEQITG